MRGDGTARCYRALNPRRHRPGLQRPARPDNMTDDNQTTLPRSFIELFIPAGALKPRAPREHIAERYELCEDLAQMLTEHAKAKLFELGVTEEDVLERVHRGLLAEGAVVEADEASWVLCRLAELLDWPMPSAPKKP